MAGIPFSEGKEEDEYPLNHLTPIGTRNIIFI